MSGQVFLSRVPVSSGASVSPVQRERRGWGLGAGTKKGSLRSPLTSSHLTLLLCSFPLLSPKSSLGGKVRLMVTGAAPVSATVLTFLRAALGCQVRTLSLDTVFPRAVLMLPVCVLFLFRRLCYS